MPERRGRSTSAMTMPFIGAGPRRTPVHEICRLPVAGACRHSLERESSFADSGSRLHRIPGCRRSPRWARSMVSAGRRTF
jgi:hypothetical protein